MVSRLHITHILTAAVVAAVVLGTLLLPRMVFAAETDFCSVGTAFSFYNCTTFVLAIIAEGILSLMGLVLWLAGLILNESVISTVIQMGANVQKIGAIEAGWVIFRDLGNIALIFLMLAIGISTILQLQSYGIRTLLAKLIIVALLLNFSLFFTKLIIDGSNLLAIQFWDQITIGENIEDSGISNKFMSALQLTSLYSTKESPGSIFAGKDSEGAPVSIDTQISKGKLSMGKIFAISILGSILILITAFVFFAAAFLLVTRFALLVLLMMLSPLAFIAMIAPLTAGYAKKWWSTLFNQSFFAPAYFALTWAALKVLESDQFKKTIQSREDATGEFGNLIGGNGGNVAVLLQFLIVIVLICASLIIAKQMGAYGSGAIIKTGSKWGKRAAGASTLGAGGRLLRTTVGRGASRGAQSEWLKDQAAKGGVGGFAARQTLKGLRGTAGASFDARKVGGLGKATGMGKGLSGGYEKVLEEQVKKRTKLADTIGAASMSSGEREEEREIRRQQAPIIERAKKEAGSAMARMKQAATPAERAAARTELERAQQQQKDAEAKLNAVAGRVKKRGEERKASYSEVLERTRTTIGPSGRAPYVIKVARKNKEAAAKIRKVKSENEKLLDKLDELASKSGD